MSDSIFNFLAPYIFPLLERLSKLLREISSVDFISFVFLKYFDEICTLSLTSMLPELKKSPVEFKTSFSPRLIFPSELKLFVSISIFF